MTLKQFAIQHNNIPHETIEAIQKWFDDDDHIDMLEVDTVGDVIAQVSTSGIWKFTGIVQNGYTEFISSEKF